MEKDSVTSLPQNTLGVTDIAKVKEIVNTPQNLTEAVRSVSAPDADVRYSLVAPVSEDDANPRRVTNYQTFMLKIKTGSTVVPFTSTIINKLIYDFCAKAKELYSGPHANGVSIDTKSLFRESNFRYTIVANTNNVTLHVTDRLIGYALMGYDPRTVNEDYLYRLREEGPLSDYFYEHRKGPIPLPITFNTVTSYTNPAYHVCVCGGREMLETLESEIWSAEKTIDDDGNETTAIPDNVKSALRNFRAGCAGCLQYERGHTKNAFSNEYCSILAGPKDIIVQSGEGGQNAIPKISVTTMTKVGGKNVTKTNEIEVYFDNVDTRVITDAAYLLTGHILIDLSSKLSDIMSESTGTFNSMHIIMTDLITRESEAIKARTKKPGRPSDEFINEHYNNLKEFVEFVILAEANLRTPKSGAKPILKWTSDNPYTSTIREGRIVSNVCTIEYSDKSLYDATFANYTMNKPNINIEAYIELYAKTGRHLASVIADILKKKGFKIGFIRKRYNEKDVFHSTSASRQKASGSSYGSGYYGPATGPVSKPSTSSRPSESYSINDESTQGYFTPYGSSSYGGGYAPSESSSYSYRGRGGSSRGSSRGPSRGRGGY